MENIRIRIDVPVYNRKNITELVLHQLRETKNPNDQINIYNDNSSEYDDLWLSQYGKVKRYLMPDQPRWKNIHLIRSKAYKDFLLEDFDFLYLTDNDAFHDPNWRKELLDGYFETKLPVSGYVSSFMCKNYSPTYTQQLLNKRFRQIKHTGGGISIFLHKTHVRQIVKRMSHLDMEDVWDCLTWSYLNNTYALTQFSYLDHFGKGGLHHQSWDQERAINPTNYLINIRSYIIDYLENKITKDEVFQKIKSYT